MMNNPSDPARSGVDRRDFFRSVGAVGAVAVTPSIVSEANAQATHGNHGTATGGKALHYLNVDEAKTVAAMVDTFIPKDQTGPGGVELDVPSFIDRQLASGWGRGAKMYLQGPYADGTAMQGWQLPMTPAEFYRAGIADLDAHCRKAFAGKGFAELGPAERQAVLEGIDKGEVKLANVPAVRFLNLVLQNTMEGYFGDPMYGGNKDMAAWKMIGFPGVSRVYTVDIEKHRGKKYSVEPAGIADNT